VRPTVIVTRPAAQAPAWVESLGVLGVDAVALPLIAIRPAPDPAAVSSAWRALAASTPAPGTSEAAGPVAMFVSPNATREFFAARAVAGPWPAHALALATGPGTVAALRDAGVPEGCIVAPPADAPRFDSEALWAVCRDASWAGREAWIVRGNGGRDWFARTLAEAGATVHVVAAYERAEVTWGDAERGRCTRALAEPSRWLWLFSSSEAIERLAVACPGADWSASRALATHPRIAETARAAGFALVEEVGVSPEAVAAKVIGSS
jgi:uroporphyrinogen-III synthase